MHEPTRLVDGVVELVPLPQAYFRVRRLIDDPGTPVAAIAEVVAADPAMTARLLRIANSAWFGHVAGVQTVEEAVRLLGNDEVHDLALAVSAVGSLQRLATPLVDIAGFWRLSVHCAVLTRRLAARRGPKLAASLFVPGLLHAIGHLVLCHRVPELMEQARVLSANGSRSLAAVERELFGCDYADVGAELLQRWQLPEAICECVRSHVRPDTARTAVLEVALVHVASVLALGAAWHPGDPDTIPAIDPLALQVAALAEEDIEPLLAGADEEVYELLDLLLPGHAQAGQPVVLAAHG